MNASAVLDVKCVADTCLANRLKSNYGLLFVWSVYVSLKK